MLPSSNTTLILILDPHHFRLFISLSPLSSFHPGSRLTNRLNLNDICPALPQEERKKKPNIYTVMKSNKPIGNGDTGQDERG